MIRLTPAPFAAALLLLACDTEPNLVRAPPARAAVRPSQPIPEGTAPLGTAAEIAALLPPGPEVTRPLLERGRERYVIFCSACHGTAGYGDGAVTARGYPRPPSFHDAGQEGLTPEHIVAVITEGFGRMYSLAERIPPTDRWAVAHYVKALQISQRPPAEPTGARIP